MSTDDHLNAWAVKQQLLLQSLVLLPWWWLLPMPLMLALSALLLYRYISVWRRWPMIGSRWALLIMLPLMALLWLLYAGQWSVEAASGFLLSMYVLKNIESKTSRDAQLLVLLGFFVIGCGFLFHQGILYSAFTLLLLLWHLNWMQALLLKPWWGHASGSARSTKAFWRWPATGRALLWAIPVAYLLYAFFPRLPPLWQMPLAGSQFVGLETELDLSSLQNLAQNSAVAFRVRFDSHPLEPLYWRGLTLNYYDENRWQELPPGKAWPGLNEIQYQPLATQQVYEVTLPATGQQMLFALDYPQFSKSDIRRQPDHSLRYSRRITQSIQYQLSQAGAPSQPEDDRVIALAQPPSLQNPEMRRLVAELTVGMSTADDKVAAIEQWFRGQPFFYHLQTPGLGAVHQIDRFLFESRVGFCSHYASSLVLMLREAGVPARMVAGYLGGEPNPSGDYWLVRQSDAHAWVEYYQPDQGWQRVDPTAWVAPDRVLSDNRDWRQTAGFNDGFWQGGSQAWVSQLLWRWDELNYQWQRRMLNFEVDEPYQRWQQWWQWLQPRVLPLLLGVLVSLAVAVAVYVGWRYGRQPSYLRHWQRLLRGLQSVHGQHPNWSASQWLALVPLAEAQALERLWQQRHYAPLTRPQQRQLERQMLPLLVSIRRQGAASPPWFPPGGPG